MENKPIGKNILAIDCALRQGSLAVIYDGAVLASVGDASSNPSRAEQVLVTVASVLDKAGLSLGGIDSIVVSNGPGSYSGIRIGMATAGGLSRALGIPSRGVSLLAALAIKGDSSELVTAVQVGKEDVAWQSFEMTPEGPVPASDAVQDSEENFVASLSTAVAPVVIVHSVLFGRIVGLVPESFRIIDAGSNIAELLGMHADKFPTAKSGKPIYLRNRNYSQAGF